jgi:hypothetical protein
MGWFTSREELALRKNDALQTELKTIKQELDRARRDLESARISGAKVRARARTLRVEVRRLRVLLEQHGIPWEHAAGVEPGRGS